MIAVSTLRRLVPVVAVVALAFLASCASNKKYGCPNKLEVSSILR
ncbi:MAG TPA: hypothetical protein PL009_05740 [Flavipsychrobacter sp.]|nr:hypothetical protein [Flavipsychrobacter sp.]